MTKNNTSKFNASSLNIDQFKLGSGAHDDFLETLSKIHPKNIFFRYINKSRFIFLFFVVQVGGYLWSLNFSQLYGILYDLIFFIIIIVLLNFKMKANINESNSHCLSHWTYADNLKRHQLWQIKKICISYPELDFVNYLKSLDGKRKTIIKKWNYYWCSFLFSIILPLYPKDVNAAAFLIQVFAIGLIVSSVLEIFLNRKADEARYVLDLLNKSHIFI